jgi:hypothetical protein
LIGFAAPSLTVLAILVGGVAYGGRVLLLLATLAQCVAATVDFVPFTRPYRPGHAKLKTRWPLYVVGAYAFSYGLVRTPIWLPIVIIAVVEAVARRRARRWSLQPGPDEDDEPFAVTRLDLSGSLQRAVAVLLVLATSAWARAPAGRVGDDLTPRHATAASGSLSCR